MKLLAAFASLALAAGASFGQDPPKQDPVPRKDDGIQLKLLRMVSSQTMLQSVQTSRLVDHIQVGSNSVSTWDNRTGTEEVSVSKDRTVVLLKVKRRKKGDGKPGENNTEDEKPDVQIKDSFQASPDQPLSPVETDNKDKK